MKIDLAAIDRTRFIVEVRGDFVLVKPGRMTHAWELSELHLRSLLCRSDGTVVSAGFPKFFNYGEKSALDRETDALIGAGCAHFTEKLDGSLIIRSVIDGEVHLRTRGNHDLGEFGWARAVVAVQWPAVLDPNVGVTDCSYLFELTSPDNRIVVAYETTTLTLLGFVDLTDLTLYDSRGVVIFGTPNVRTLDLSAADCASIAAGVTPLRGDEGVVVWAARQDETVVLTKFKSEWYLRAHALRSFATHDRVRDYSWANNVTTREQFVECLMRDGIDWETATQHSALFTTVRAEIDARLINLHDLTSRLAHVRDLPDRKAKALALQEGAGDAFGVLIHWTMGDTAKYEEAREAYSLGLSRGEFSNLRKTKGQPLVLDLEAAKAGE